MNRELKKMQQRTAAKVAEARQILHDNNKRTTTGLDSMLRNMNKAGK